MRIDLEMELHNAKSSSYAGMRKRKKRKRKSDALCNYNDSGHDCPEGASSMQDTPQKGYSCSQSTADISSNSGLIAESTVDINPGLIEAQSNSDLVCSESKIKRKKKQKQKRHNAPTTDNTASTFDISSNSGLIAESKVDINSGLVEAQSNSDLVCSENEIKRKRKQKQKRYNAPTDNTESTVDISYNSGLIAESTVDINSGLMEAKCNSDLVCSESKIKRKRKQKQKQKRHNAPTTDNTASTVDISSNSGLIAESTVDINSGLIEAQSNSDLVCSENKIKKKRKQKRKRHNAPTDITESTVDISSNSGLIAESTVNINSGLMEAQYNSDLVCSQKKKKKKRRPKQKWHNAPTDNAESTVDIRYNSGLIEAHNNSSLLCLENKKKRKRQQLDKKPSTDADLQEGASKTTSAPFETVALVDMITKRVSETAPLEVEALGDTSTKMDLAADMSASVDASTVIHSAQNLNLSERKNLRKKLHKQGVNVLEHNSENCVLPGDKSLNKNLLPDKDSSVQPNGNLCSFNRHNTSENGRDVNLKMENDKNFEKENTRKMDFAATDIDMKASVDTITVIHSAQSLSRSERKKLRKKLRKQVALVLEHDAALDHVLPGDNSLSNSMFPEKHSSLQPAVDMCSKNELVVKMENGKNLEKEDTEKMDLAATPIEMNTSVDTSTMIHSAQNLSRSQRKKLRKKLSKQGDHVLEHGASKDRVLPRDNFPSKSMCPEKLLSVQPSVDICSKSELVDVSLYNGQITSKNGSVFSLQTEHGKNLEKVDLTKMDLEASPTEMNTSVDTSTVIHSAQNFIRSEKKKLRKKLRKQGVHVLEHDASKYHVPPDDNSLSKNVSPEKHSSMQPSVDICSKNELVLKRSNGDASLFNGHGTSENDSAIILQMEHGKNLVKVEATKMNLAATPIEMNASVDTSTMIHSAQNLSPSERKKLRKKLRKQGVHVLEHDASKNHVPPEDNSLRKNVFSEKHSSLQLSVDISSKNKLVVKRSNGDTSFFNGHSTSENDSIISLQMEDGKNSEKVDATKMDLAATPIEMNASVDTSTMIHSAQNLSRLERMKSRKKLSKQGVHVLEHDSSKDHVLPGDNSLSRNVFPEKHSSLQLSIDICSKNELAVSQSNGDVCFFNGHNASQNTRVIDLQMPDGKHLENKEAKPDPKAAELVLISVREDFPLSVRRSSSSNSANRSLLEKDDVSAESHPVSSEANKDDVSTESHPVSSEASNIITYKRRKIFKTYITTNREKVSDSLINSLDCIKEDEDSLTKNVLVLPEGRLDQKERDKLDGIQISVQDASHGDGVSDEIPAHPMEDNLSGLDRSCKLPKEQHVEVETKRTETFPPSLLGAMKSDVLHAACKENHPQILSSLPERVCVGHSKKKLLVLDVNGLLADVVQSPCRRYKPDKMVSKKAVFKRPYCDEFLLFCFERFNVGVWSSRVKKNLDIVIDFLMADSRKNLLFCWHQSQCSKTGLNTIENKEKPLVLKELKKLWEKLEPNLPWEKGEYNETNTLLLDDSPYKALCNPAHTAIFPYPYDYRNAKDASLGSGGDLRVYLEGLADAENVQEYVRQNPFGQRAITEKNPSWGFYSKVFRTKPRPPPYDDGNGTVANAKSCEPCDNGNTSFTCQQP